MCGIADVVGWPDSPNKEESLMVALDYCGEREGRKGLSGKGVQCKEGTSAAGMPQIDFS